MQYLFDPREAQLVHFYSQLEDVIQTLTLSLRLGSVITPNVTAGGTNISIGINITWSEVIITYIPCLRTSTAYASGYLFIAASKPLVRSSSKAVFSIMGIFKVSKNPSMPFPLPRGMPLICSMLLISKQASGPLLPLHQQGD